MQTPTPHHSTFYSQQGSHWSGWQSDWKKPIRDALRATDQLGTFARYCLGRFGELVLIALLLAANALCVTAALVAVPVLVVTAAAAFVLAVSGTVTAFEAVLNVLIG